MGSTGANRGNIQAARQDVLETVLRQQMEAGNSEGIETIRQELARRARATEASERGEEFTASQLARSPVGTSFTLAMNSNGSGIVTWEKTPDGWWSSMTTSRSSPHYHAKVSDSIMVDYLRSRRRK